MISEQYKTAIQLGDASSEKGDIYSAVQHYERALALQPDSPDIYCKLGRLYNYNHQTTRAEHSFEKALKIEPDSPLAINGLYNIYIRKGDFEGIKRLYKHIKLHGLNFLKKACSQLCSENIFEPAPTQTTVQSNSKESPAIFIGGPGRSGKSILLNALDQHKELAGLDETKLTNHFDLLSFPYRYCHTEQKKDVLKRFKSQWLNTYYSYDVGRTSSSDVVPASKGNPRNTPYGFHQGTHRGLHRWFSKDEVSNYMPILDTVVNFSSEADIWSVLGRMIGCLLDHYAKRRQKTYWVEANSINNRHSQFLTACFPNPKLIHVIRDGRDVACSATKCPRGPKEPQTALNNWALSVVLSLLNQSQLPRSSYINIRYEDLVLKFEKTLHQIVNFLQIDWEDNLLALKVHPNSIGKYKRELDAETKEYAIKTYQPLFSILGYEI